MVEEDKDESPHVNTDETDEEVQDTCLSFDDDLDSEVDDDNPNTQQTPEYTKDKYNVKMMK
jgi:hypothetical protein